MLHTFFEDIQDLLSQGGIVLYLIFIVTFVLWGFIIERLWYFYFDFKTDRKNILNKWEKKRPHFLLSKKIWKEDFSTLTQKLNKNLSFIKTLVSLLPLMGLLGTVTGMVTVFEVMAQIGTGNARLMAGGISMATIPTMAGMVGALSGIYISRVLENIAKSKQNKFFFHPAGPYFNSSSHLSSATFSTK